MKTGLSKRERVLIFIALAALLVFGAVKYAISPLYNYYNDSTGRYDILSLEKTMLELKLQSEEVTRANHAEAKARVEEIEQQYPLVKPNEEIDRILTGLCLQNDLSPSALNISDAVDFYAAEEPVEESEQSEQESQEEEKLPAAFVTVDATMLVTGDYKSLKKLISAVEKMDYIRLGRVSYLYPLNEETPNPVNVLVLFELTMRKHAPETTDIA